jgi:hypothetical protein
MKTSTHTAVLRFLKGIALALVAAGASALMAQEPVIVKLNYGFQVGAMSPMGDLADMQGTGFGGAVFFEMVFSSCYAARGRVEYTVFGEMEQSGLGWSYAERLKQTGVMLDIIYYNDFKDAIYPFAGVGYFNRTVDVTFSGAAGGGSGSADLKSELALCAGLGVNFTRHLGVEVKYTQCEYNWAQASLLFRF